MTELIYCASGNRRMAEIAINHRFTYGAQLPHCVYYPVEFADQNWKTPDRARYMAALAEHRPRMATVLDLEREDQLDEVLSWADEAAQHVSETIIIIPKAFNTIDRIPRDVGGRQVRLGYSVPTKFGATSVPVWEFRDRPVHLLGGSPQRQYALREYLNVASIDGNYSMKQANVGLRFFAPVYCSYAANGYFPKIGEVSPSARLLKGDLPYLAFNLSCINIRNLWAYGAPCTIRYGVLEDVDQIIAISRQWRAELGYVMRPALRESIERRQLYVAVIDAQVVGFANTRTRRDGLTTIYEIAVHRDWQARKIGHCLLNAVPRPTQLKTTVDNARANAFYEAAGFEMMGTEAGRKRPLNLWLKSTILEAQP